MGGDGRSLSGSASQKITDPRSLWGYQPVQQSKPPLVKEVSLSEIDRFVLAKLEEKKLSFSPEADQRTLIRRAYYDLIGLPPSVEEIEKFVASADPQKAYERLLDQLLASPRYGEAQARRWLDLARYADTKGYVFLEDRNYPFAYTYRDWVIRAFNEDMPYDRFIRLQLAADRMKCDSRDLAAMGFLTVGRRFLNNQADIIDDRLDTTCRTFLGLTVTCARCHDHKYDPIPAKDYYSLYGVFASSVEPKELPLIGEVEQTPELLAFQNGVQKMEEDHRALMAKIEQETLSKLRSAEQVAACLLAAQEVKGNGGGEAFQAIARQYDVKPAALTAWRAYLDSASKNQSPLFAPWFALAAISNDAFTTQTASKALNDLVAQVEKKKQPLNATIIEALRKKPPATLKEAAIIYGDLLAKCFAESKTPAEKEAAVVLSEKGALRFTPEQTSKLINRLDQNKITASQKKIDAFKATSPVAPARAMVLNDSLTPNNPYVFLRGNPGNRGPDVPRQFLAALSGPDRKPFKDGSGRLELADAIADAANPLTSRVMVNRLWISHFGQGLVRTPSDFGVRSDRPTHPELLDWLATRFVSSGWSIKKTHRLIMMSRTYRQQSDVSAELAKIDPENRLLSRMNRRRLDFESLRDSFLITAGQLDPKAGGKPVDIFKEPFSHRRTIYGFIDRQNLPGTLRAFDFASPDQHSPQRFVTTVPQQALFLMNSPFVIEQARQLAVRAEAQSSADSEARAGTLIRLVNGRTATADELALATEFIQHIDQKGVPETASPWQYGCGHFNSVTKRVEDFTPLPHWTGDAWQSGPKLPSAPFGWAVLNAQGGHPGRDHAVVRRWVSPVDGQIKITGTLNHPSKEGDGVRGRMVSSRQGELGVWKVMNGQVVTNLSATVAKGEAIDFLTDCVGSENNDSFAWAPVIRFESKQKETVWDASRDFSGPVGKNTSLDRWEQLAQVLLLSNEFAFVD